MARRGPKLLHQQVSGPATSCRRFPTLVGDRVLGSSRFFLLCGIDAVVLYPDAWLCSAGLFVDCGGVEQPVIVVGVAQGPTAPDTGVSRARALDGFDELRVRVAAGDGDRRAVVE